jgi:hypothetical protein
MEGNKQKIIELFNNNVKGRKPNILDYDKDHDGKEGHWLEKQMNIKHNPYSHADLLGYEMKNDTHSKTTFGDWSPDIALWKKQTPYDSIPKLDRDSEFLVYFGNKKNNRYSWSGSVSPKINKYNKFGQILKIDENKNICAMYSYSKDTRTDKENIIPNYFKKEDLILAKWLKESIKLKLEKKFNQNGWFKCYKNKDGIYTKISFGKPINYDDWLLLIKNGLVIFDSGMHAGNKRPYSMWRATNAIWETMIIDSY